MTRLPTCGHACPWGHQLGRHGREPGPGQHDHRGKGEVDPRRSGAGKRCWRIRRERARRLQAKTWPIAIPSEQRSGGRRQGLLPPGPMKPIPPAMKCRGPCQLIEPGGPAGVPGGKPSIGSATKMPAPMSPRPYRPRRMGPHVPARPGCRRCRIPAAAAMTRRPDTMKLATWIQPSEPLLMRLRACRRISKPSRKMTCSRPTTT